MTTKLICTLPLAAALAACAATDTTPEPKVVAGKDVICERTVPTGSTLPTLRCRTVERAQQDQDAAQKALSGGHQRPRVNGLGG